MKKPNSPCYNCQDRRPGCHGECDRFAEYQERLQKYNERCRSNYKHIHAAAQPFNQQKEKMKNNRRKIK